MAQPRLPVFYCNKHAQEYYEQCDHCVREAYDVIKRQATKKAAAEGYAAKIDGSFKRFDDEIASYFKPDPDAKITVTTGDVSISDTKKSTKPADYEARKQRPLCTGLLDYFPDALMEVAYCSYVCNEQHNPGEKLHWAKDKSIGEGNEIMRHLKDRGKIDSDKVRHSAKLAWRSLELLQREIEAERSLIKRV